MGGAGVDIMSGGYDSNLIEADDDAADTQIHGDRSRHRLRGRRVDPATIAVETVIPR